MLLIIVTHLSLVQVQKRFLEATMLVNLQIRQGKPILSAIESSGLQNLICVVVRYFGGIKLGVGGLIRLMVRQPENVLIMLNELLTYRQLI